MENGPYQIVEAKTEGGTGKPSVDLGDPKLNQQVHRLLHSIRKVCRIFLIAWDGNKVPDGAIILGREIAWTQNGQVIAKRVDDPNSRFGDVIGTYDRLVEFGGLDRKRHVMLVFIWPDAEKKG